MDLNLKFNVFVKNNDGTIKHMRPKRKTQISNSNALRKMESGYLKVTYKSGVWNDGTFFSKKDFLQALNAWTEQDLLNFIMKGDWR